MKVALLKSRIENRGGLEKATKTLATAFQQRGCEVSLLTTGSEHGINLETAIRDGKVVQDFDAESHRAGDTHSQMVKGSPALCDYGSKDCINLPSPIAVSRINVSSTSKFSLYHHLKFDAACRFYLKKNPHDIVFGMERNRSQTHYRAGCGVHAAYLERRKLFEGAAKFYLNPLHRFLLSQEKAAFEDPNLLRLFTNSYMVKEEILSYYRVKPEKIIVVHNGVEWDEFEKPFQEKKKSDCPTFLFVGNGYQRKGLTYLLKALPSGCRLLVVGREKNLSYFQKLAPKNVTFYGPQADLIPFYQVADALVIPSLYDPFANVTTEALAMGVYVVSSKFNGGHEILKQETGYIIDDLFSKEAMESALQTALTTSINPLLIRNSVKALDFSFQLSKIVDTTLYPNNLKNWIWTDVKAPAIERS